MKHQPRRLALVLTGLMLAACGKPDPIRIGFIGGLSDHSSDLGPAALNAVQMAADQLNRAGGIHGRPVELVVRDDAQNPETAVRAARELIAAKVDAAIGPFTSSMAEVIVPILGQAGIFEVSPTITAMAFYGKDDNLFRINRTTRDNARDYAQVLTRRGHSRIAVAYDLRNRSFTESWLQEFRDAVQALGARVPVAVPYESSASADFRQVIAQMVQARPDSLFFISSTIDVARLAQEARQQAPKLPLAASEWAATEQLARLGGSVVEGLIISQSFDREDTSPRYTEFAQAYQQRFQISPSYTSVTAYDAATVIFAALQSQQSGESLKSAALRHGPYQGLQQTMVFDANGDAQRQVYFTKILGGRFIQLDR